MYQLLMFQVINTITSETETNKITLKYVPFVPDIESALLSKRKALQNGCKLLEMIDAT